MTEYDHPIDFDDIPYPAIKQLEDLSDHELLELYRDLAEGGATFGFYDTVVQRIVKRFDEYEAEDLLGFIVDGRFTPEGVSVSAYDKAGRVIDETWFTWDEVEFEKEQNDEMGTSAFTFELEIGR